MPHRHACAGRDFLLAVAGAVLATALSAAPAAAALLRVPADFPDLPTALAAAAPGDTVAVAADHVVAGGVVIPGLDLAVIGGWDAGFTAPGTGRSSIAGTPDAPALRLAPPAGGSPLVAGFAITGGGGATLAAPLPGRYGGGVLVEGGAPELRDLTITAAGVGSNAELGAGGGLALLQTDAVVAGVVISGCTATWGGGVFIQGGAPQLVDVTLADNLCGPGAAGQIPQGAGACVRQADATLDGCLLTGGRGAARGGGLAWIGQRGRTLTLTGCELRDNTMATDGGGLFGEGGNVTITGGVFADNAPAPQAPYTSGGGAYLTGARVAVAGARFTGNRADAGGGLTVNTGAEATVQDCVFHANTASFFGSALNYQSNAAGAIAGNTLAANVSEDGDAALTLISTSPTLAANLVAFNTGDGISVSGGTPQSTCNDVFGNTGTAWVGLDDPTGTGGNLAVDPLFCDLAAGDLALGADSPCLAAPGCGRIGALGQGCGGAVAVPNGVARAPLTVTAFPNPANPAVTLRAALPAAGPVRLTVHDVRGRLVRTLVDGQRPAGMLAVRWDGRDGIGRGVASGVYRYRLVAGPRQASGSLVLLR